MADPNLKNAKVVGGSTAGSLEMEMGAGGGHQVKLEPGAGTVKGSKGQVKTGKEDKAFQELEGLVNKLHLRGDLQRKVMTGGFLSNFEKARMETADRGKAALRIKWKEEVRKELLKREDYKRPLLFATMKEATAWETKSYMVKLSVNWREGYKHERTNFLIHEVIPILFENHFDAESKGKLIVTCRPVSSDWKASAEACILSHYQPGVQAVRLRDVPICAPHFVSSQTVARFNYWSEQCYKGKNPFFARKMVMAGGALEWKNNLEFWKGAEALLRRWGQEIWIFMIRFDKEMSFEVMYEQLVKYLKLMPKLRCLVIFDTPGSASNSMKINMMRHLGQDIYGPLKTRIARNPLPDLPHLKQLQLQDFVIPPLAQAMFAKYGGLEDVLLRGSESGEDPHPMESLTRWGHPLPHLKFLTISTFARLEAFDLSRNCPTLEKFLLKELYVESPADVLVVFKNLNRLKPISTLRRLSLVIQPCIWGPMIKLSEEQLKCLRLDLPQLDSFSLNAMHINLKNIDFLLPCVGLKKLELVYQKIKVKNMPKDENQEPSSSGGKKGNKKSKVSPRLDEVIQFFEYTNRLYESNLWKLFPELKRVTISTTSSVLNGDEEQRGYIPGKQIVKCKIKLYSREGFMKCLGDGSN